MKLAEVFSHLAYGELSQLALGNNTEGEIDEKVYPIILSHLNLGLGAIYKRFNLKEGRLTFPLSSAGNVYKLGVADLNKIEKVLTSKEEELPLNDGSNEYSCFTPSMNTIRIPQRIIDGDADVPEKYQTSEIIVVYRANHPKIELVLGDINPFTTELELPYTHLEALLYFIASRVNNPIGMTNEFHAGNSWAAKYENECQRLEASGYQVDPQTEESLFTRRGWV